jgi:hypothetical protein
MDFEEINKQTQELYLKLHDAHVQYLHLWENQIVFTWRWWFGVALIIIPWSFWLVIRKKDSSSRLLHAGLVAIILSSFLDMIGVVLALWSYPISVFPIMPGYIPYDFCALPVATMLFIQFLPKIKAIYKALVYGAIGGFVFEPMMNWIGVYNKKEWKSYYSFPILVAIYLVCNYFAKKKIFEPID